MKNLLFISSLLALTFALYNFQTASANKIDIDIGKAPIVVELYTSQGCSSCPPAEKILGQLSKHRRIIALSCHVTYWDYLGWKDTFGNQACTDRQLAFQKTRGKGNYYTPQMIINGVDEFPGHRSSRIKKAIEKSKNNPVKPISLSHQNRETVIASLPNAVQGDYTLWVFGYQKPHAVEVKKGENRGRTLTSTNTVRMLDSLGKWDGQHKMERFNLDQADNIDGIVILAQQNGYGPIIASGKLEF